MCAYPGVRAMPRVRRRGGADPRSDWASVGPVFAVLSAVRSSALLRLLLRGFRRCRVVIPRYPAVARKRGAVAFRGLWRMSGSTRFLKLALPGRIPRGKSKSRNGDEMNQQAIQGVGASTPRIKEVMGRIGSRPALIHAAVVGDYFGESAPYRAVGGIAVVDVVGPLLNEGCDCGGCTCYGDIQEQLRAADANPNVKGILLNVNSPGGQTDNAFETASLIAEIAKRTEVWACASVSAYSAAYLLASQANRIYCSPVSGGVGSIGVFCTHFDLSGALEGAGIKVTLVSAGKGKTDGNPYEPLSETALADMKQYVGYLYGEFVGAVSRGRGLATGGIVNMGARCFDGATAAISSGLADVSGDLSKALNDMGAEIQRMPLGSSRATLGRKAITKPAAMDPESEIRNLCAIARQPGMADLFIADGYTPAEVFKALINGMDTSGKGFRSAR